MTKTSPIKENTDNKEGPLVYLVVGEPSGDLLAARLMRALERETCGDIRFAGIGGEEMCRHGLDSLFDVSDLAIMGLLEVVPRIPLVLRRIRQTVTDISIKQPDVIVTVDSWGFTGRVNKALRAAKSSIPRVHYVAPQVWAWKEGRARKMAGVVDHLMTLLPNEPPYFEAYLPTTHVGHPVIEGGADKGSSLGFRAKMNIPETAPVLCVLPGSRHNEIERLLPIFEETVGLLSEQYKDLHVIVPTVMTVFREVQQVVSKWTVPVVTVVGEKQRYNAFAASNVAMAASGTVALELAMAGVPHVVAYKVSSLTALAVRRLLKIRYVNLVNLILDAPIVPELLQENCNPERLVGEISRLLEDTGYGEAQQSRFKRAMDKLGCEDGMPSNCAAHVVLKEIERGKRLKGAKKGGCS